MAKATNPTPAGRNTVTPYLIVDGAAKAIQFYTKALGATAAMEPIMRPDGKVGHAELKLGDSLIMLADEMPDMDIHAPKKFGGSPISIHVYVADVDKVAKQAEAAGATIKRPVQDMFYGDRTGSFTDPFGHTWHIATHIEDVPHDELVRRAKAAMPA